MTVTDSSLIDRIRGVLVRYANTPDLSPDEIEVTASVFGPTGIIVDSLAVLDALCELEDELDVEIPDEDLTEALFESVESLMIYLAGRLEGRSP